MVLAVSIMLIRRGAGRSIRQRGGRPDRPIELYIDDRDNLNDQQRAKMVQMNMVAIDPGKLDLIYAVDGNSYENRKILRYTQEQRRKEQKIKRYRFIRWEVFGGLVIAECTVRQWEASLSRFNHKTCYFESFRDYIEQKALVNSHLTIPYSNLVYRKLRVSGYINTQQSEARFMNKFKENYG